jgi:hypothetical protein
MGLACIAVFGLSWVVGSILCRAVLGPDWTPLPRALRLGLGWAAGAAFSGITTFWAIVLAPTHRGVFVAVSALLGLALYFVPARRPIAAVEVQPIARHRGQRMAYFLAAAAFLVTLALWIARCFEIGVNSPAGGWDAFSIWNQRARFFFLGPDEWTRGFDPALDWSHPEYPNLVPSLVVYGWLPEGRCVALAPVAVALLTHVGKLLLMIGLTQAAYPRSAWPWILGIFYATIRQEWNQETAWQYADRPLALFLLGAIGCVALAIRTRTRRWYLLAGFFWGAAAFCKDEGKAALVVLAVGASLATICCLSHGGGWRPIGNLVLLGLGLTPGIGSLGLQWHQAPVTTKLLDLMTTGPLADRERTKVIAHFLIDRLQHPEWSGMWLGCGLVLITLIPWMRRRELWLLWVFPAAQLFVYLLIFQLTPQPLLWHLDSALPRLLYHVGPIVFLAASWLVLECAEASRRNGRGGQTLEPPLGADPPTPPSPPTEGLPRQTQPDMETFGRQTRPV